MEVFAVNPTNNLASLPRHVKHTGLRSKIYIFQTANEGMRRQTSSSRTPPSRTFGKCKLARTALCVYLLILKRTIALGETTMSLCLDQVGVISCHLYTRPIDHPLLTPTQEKRRFQPRSRDTSARIRS